MSNITQAERISSLEVQVAYLRAEQAEQSRRFEASQAEMKIAQADMVKKMDELLALRNKGAGVFWLASVLFGTSIIGAVTYVASLFR